MVGCSGRPDTWQEVVSTEDEGQRLARLEEYSGYLDVVESQLLKEIASRSDHFFEAAGVVQVGLNPAAFLCLCTILNPTSAISVEQSLECRGED